MRAPSLDLKKPCPGCPFTRGPEAVHHLGRARILGIIGSDASFPCHRTIEETGGPPGCEPQECAGRVIFQLVNEACTGYLRAIGRCGLIDVDAFLAHQADVVTDLFELIDLHEDQPTKRRKRPKLAPHHRTPPGDALVIRCGPPCRQAADGSSCRFHDAERVGPDTPLPPYRDGCACWVEEIDPNPQADTSAAEEGTRHHERTDS